MAPLGSRWAIMDCRRQDGGTSSDAVSPIGNGSCFPRVRARTGQQASAIRESCHLRASILKPIGLDDSRGKIRVCLTATMHSSASASRRTEHLLPRARAYCGEKAVSRARTGPHGSCRSSLLLLAGMSGNIEIRRGISIPSGY